MKCLVFIFTILIAGNSFSQTAKDLNLEKGVAIKGYDPVSYFVLGKALKGVPGISFSYNGATYYFADDKDRQTFKNDPAKYAPQYGGWCAYAMGKTGEKVEVDPETFKITNGKLFLFYNKFFNNTLKSWDKDEANLHAKADANWLKIISK